MNLQTDVVIVGGGPTGLMLASELALGGVSTTVLEKRAEPVAQSRAQSVHPRTIEIFALRNIAQRFIERGVRVPTGHYAALDTRLDFTALDTSFPFGLLIPQTLTERLLEERARELGVQIRRGWRVESVRQMPDCVSVTGSAEGTEFTADALYLVGADGARSVVRQQADIAFPGNDNRMSIYFGDVFITGGSVPPTGGFQRRNPSGIVEAFPNPDGRRRIVFVDAERLSIPVTTPVTLEEMQDGARRILGPDVSLSDPSWMSRFGNETRLAECYRRGRIFLAGDAAHIHLPAGGQGMNTGLQDAMNLGWKLAGVLRGSIPEAILDSYDLERRPVGARLIENTTAQAALIRTFFREGDSVWSAFSELLRLPSANRHVANMITALDTKYPRPLPGVTPSDCAALLGSRLPDLPLRLANGTGTSLYALLFGGNWVDLRMNETAHSPLPAGFSAGCVRPCYASPAADQHPFEGLASVLIRPDGHIAYCA